MILIMDYGLGFGGTKISHPIMVSMSYLNTKTDVPEDIHCTSKIMEKRYNGQET